MVRACGAASPGRPAVGPLHLAGVPETGPDHPETLVHLESAVRVRETSGTDGRDNVPGRVGS
ncbi:hypothetical protein EBF04_22630 [Streptomyces sp. I6]|nr:hypothetical protein EBF04_22630 [Streptomyces sp. I6]